VGRSDAAKDDAGAGDQAAHAVAVGAGAAAGDGEAVADAGGGADVLGDVELEVGDRLEDQEATPVSRRARPSSRSSALRRRRPRRRPFGPPRCCT